MRKDFLIPAALLACVTAFAGGAKEGAAGTAPYTIQGIFPGDTPIDFDAVLREAVKRMAGTVNAKLDFTFIPWSDYGDKVKLKFAGGDAFDLQVKAGFPPNWFEANTFNGKIMGIPLGNTLGLIRGV